MWKRPLDVQYNTAFAKILQAINDTEGDISICFSGGKDSSLLLDMYAEAITMTKWADKPIQVLFANTTNETDAMLHHVRSFIPWIEQKYGVKINFKEIRPDKGVVWANFVLKNGIPLTTKKQARCIRDLRDDIKRLGLEREDIERLHRVGDRKAVQELQDMGLTQSSILHLTGYVSSRDAFGGMFILSKKWRPLLWGPVDITEQCCVILKEGPIKKLSAKSCMTGEQAAESEARTMNYLANGCNARMAKGEYKSMPFGPMTQDGILWALKYRNTPLCEDYGEIVQKEDGHYTCTKCTRTGCALCGFGCQYDTDRFVRLAETEPAKVKFAFKSREQGGAGLGDEIEYMNEYCGTKIKIPDIR
jgi:3'-phosphoadenosine 5'-phosphosulfate sulfotransferase (PAPS reductase)/FAD synthetase